MRHGGVTLPASSAARHTALAPCMPYTSRPPPRSKPGQRNPSRSQPDPVRGVCKVQNDAVHVRPVRLCASSSAQPQRRCLTQRVSQACRACVRGPGAMLTVKETAQLVDILQAGGTLEAAAGAFQRAFVRADHFRVAAAICMMLEDNLLPAKQRATALFVLQDLYKSEAPGVHPFLPFLVSLLHSPPSELQLHERNLLCQLLAQPPSQKDALGKKTPAELELLWPAGSEPLPPPNLVRRAPSPLRGPHSAPCIGRRAVLSCMHGPLPRAWTPGLWRAPALSPVVRVHGPLPLVHVRQRLLAAGRTAPARASPCLRPPRCRSRCLQAALRQSFAERDTQVPDQRRTGISPLVQDPQPLEPSATSAGADAGASGTNGLGEVLGIEQQLGLLRFEPQLLRPPPPLLDSRDEEVLWLNPHADHSFDVLWDYSMCADNVKGAEVRELMSKAFRGPLVPGQQQQVLAELESDGKLVYHCGLTPKRLPDLVENNPVIAIEVLLKLMSSSQITDYFSVRGPLPPSFVPHRPRRRRRHAQARALVTLTCERCHSAACRCS